MKEYFTQEQKEREINKVMIEDDNVLLMGEYIEGEGKSYVLTGSAVIDGETYHDFQVEFELLNEPEEKTAESVMSQEWDWYDYLCD
ncbi:MAG: hypothetical protein PHY44_02980 [Lachnospiraceae bacterium]|nr:hypothetical protein [Lachnospiraceae bacterium]